MVTTLPFTVTPALSAEAESPLRAIATAVAASYVPAPAVAWLGLFSAMAALTDDAPEAVLAVVVEPDVVLLVWLVVELEVAAALPVEAAVPVIEQAARTKIMMNDITITMSFFIPYSLRFCGVRRAGLRHLH